MPARMAVRRLCRCRCIVGLLPMRPAMGASRGRVRNLMPTGSSEPLRARHLLLVRTRPHAMATRRRVAGLTTQRAVTALLMAAVTWAEAHQEARPAEAQAQEARARAAVDRSMVAAARWVQA